jgi:hypothetical protein
MLWDEYTIAKDLMFKKTHNSFAPWTIIKSDNKKKARINCIKHILNLVEYPDKIHDNKISIDNEIIIYGREEIININNKLEYC